MFDIIYLYTNYSCHDFFTEYYYYYHFTHLSFFTPVLADGLSLEFDWQHISSSLLDSSQYFGQS